MSLLKTYFILPFYFENMFSFIYSLATHKVFMKLNIILMLLEMHGCIYNLINISTTDYIFINILICFSH